MALEDGGGALDDADRAAELAVVAAGPFGCEMVDRLGRPLPCARTDVAPTSSRPARPTEGRIMVFVNKSRCARLERNVCCAV